MGVLAAAAWRWEPAEIEGGYLQVTRNVWRGVVRDKANGAFLWQCDHIHSRPEYNARYRADGDRVASEVWEYSALNCGLAAQRQWNKFHYKHDEGCLVGKIGLCESRNIPVDRRDDTGFAVVGASRFKGRVLLRLDGHRLLEVAREQGGGYHDYGYVLPDAPKSETGLRPSLPSTQMMTWLTAASLLCQNLWGLSFRRPGSTSGVDTAKPEWAKGFVPVSEQRTTGPHVETVRRNGRRQYAVLDDKGREIDVKPHRGQAHKAAEKLRKEATTSKESR